VRFLVPVVFLAGTYLWPTRKADGHKTVRNKEINPKKLVVNENLRLFKPGVKGGQKKKRTNCIRGKKGGRANKRKTLMEFTTKGGNDKRSPVKLTSDKAEEESQRLKGINV